VQKRIREPWMSADEYGRSLPQFTVNLLTADIARSAAFYRDVLAARVIFQDEDFAAFDLAGLQFCVHADHTYDQHPWHARLVAARERGLGAELRLLGVQPEPVEARARQHGCTILQATMDKPHGWRDVIVADPDGYAWAIGVKT
jgi:catechol 2,3-dioxygenase-like lactoylglutathione lyase family enzyme